MKLAWTLALTLSLIGAGAAQTPQNGYWAMPKHVSHARGVLVLHAWWGLNDDVKAFCRRLSKAGFVAYAPDLYDGKIATTRKEAQALVDASDAKESQNEPLVENAAKDLSEKTEGKPIGVVAFSMGCYYALHLANHPPVPVNAVVLYYGTGSRKSASSKAAYLGNFAGKDEFVEDGDRNALERALKDAGHSVTFYTYPGTGHWFAEPGVKEAYNRDAAELAWKRTIQFLRSTISN